MFYINILRKHVVKSQKHKSFLPSSPTTLRCLCVVIWGSSTSGVEVLECGSTRGLRGAPLVLTDETTASVFTDINGCDWQTAVTVLVVLLLLLLFVVYRGYGWYLQVYNINVSYYIRLANLSCNIWYRYLLLPESVDSVLPLLLWLFNIRACNDAASPSTGNNSPFDVFWDECRGDAAEWDCVSDWDGLSEK